MTDSPGAVFVTVVCYHGLDPYPEVYATLDAAIEGARAAALRHAGNPETIVEDLDPQPDTFLGQEDPYPWLFHIAWSTEGTDAAWVTREEIR